ncbi:sigma-70 family RNA polymerase sigma factor [uncultured Flavobacterium sp.]|uniref:RNA polymerase sigma factor n=1 Tax=uncultured Flavobacterium sp. TaxID=165435 RepID=UPI0025D5E2B8|nr:sigma-70 family RNA polymerase sigma factor [uncultured Flavobacterium sp.]
MTNLIKGLQEGNQSSFKEIYDTHHSKVYFFVSRFTSGNADTEDIVQNVFIHLWQYRHNIAPDAVLDAVLFRSCRQELSKWYKKQETFPELVHGPLRDEAETEYEDDDITAAQLEKIRILLEQLPSKRKKIFTLHKFEQLTHKEIAIEMSMTPGAVAKQISKTLSYLKEHAVNDQLHIWFAVCYYCC